MAKTTNPQLIARLREESERTRNDPVSRRRPTGAPEQVTGVLGATQRRGAGTSAERG